MHLVDIYPDKGCYRPGETARLVVKLSSNASESGTLQLQFFHIEQLISEQILTVKTCGGAQQVTVNWQPPAESRRGYGVQARLLDGSSAVQGQAATALDVLESWVDFPRYGFLTDFTPQRADSEATISALARFHINALQFYDWQYRHHALLPPSGQFTDPLGRTLSLQTVLSLLDAGHAHGMAALAYLAIYAAGLDFWRGHPDWALYDEHGKALTFFDFLGLVDPSPGRPWAAHLLAECDQALAGLPFDGLQVDQYGDPKQAFDASARAVDLPGAFAAFMQSLRAAHPNTGLLFNAVGNWPIQAVAPAPTDAVYIEIWPPATRYTDVAEIVLNARRLSGQKAVIIALYLPADQPANNLLADAVILAAGGTRIELGEQARLLSDPYFPKHQALPADLYRALRRCTSFAVRYGELLGPLAVEEPAVRVSAPEGVLAYPRQSQDWLSIPLVNTRGLPEPAWHQAHPFPIPLENLHLAIHGVEAIDGIWWASPDRDSPELVPVEWRREGSAIMVILPRLEIFSLLAIRMAPARSGTKG